MCLSMSISFDVEGGGGDAVVGMLLELGISGW